MKPVFNQILNILYPRHCPVCHRILEDQRSQICPKCKKHIPPITGPRCMKCGRPVEQEREYCSECNRRTHEFTEGLGVFVYNALWKNSIEHYKYFGCREYGDFYAACMSAALTTKIVRWNPDLVVPVPLHPRKQRARGFNQSWILAQGIGKRLDIPAEEHLVTKVRMTKSQKKLTEEERKQNLKEAFCVTRPIPGKRILVVDDMYTTGSTMDAMAACLKASGASRIYFVTLCIGIR